MPTRPCPHCDGDQINPLTPARNGLCSDCHGTGKRNPFNDPLGVLADVVTGESDCETCHSSKKCQECGGSGEIEGPDSSSSDESLFESKSESEEEVEKTDQSDAGDDESYSPIEVSTSEPEVKESYSTYSGYGGLGYSRYDRRRKRRSKRRRRGRRYRGRGYSSYGGRYSPSSGGGASDWGIGLGGLVVIGLVIAGIISVIYFVVTFEYKHTPYKPRYLPTITTGPSGTTVHPGAGVASAKAYQAYKDGAFFLQQGNYKESIRYLAKAIQLKPDFADAFITRGNAYRELGQSQRAIQDYNEGIRLKPNNAFAYWHRAFAYGKAGQYPRAINDYTQVIRLNPNHKSAYGNRGLAYAKLGQHHRAIQDYTQAIRLKPDDALSYCYRGISHYNLGQYQRAADDFNRAVRLKPDLQVAYEYRDRARKALDFARREETDHTSPTIPGPSISRDGRKSETATVVAPEEESPKPPRPAVTRKPTTLEGGLRLGKSYSFKLSSDGMINGVEFKPGKYKLKLNGQGEALIYRKRELITKVQVEVQPLPRGSARGSVARSADGTIREIRLKKHVIVFQPPLNQAHAH